MEKLNIVTWLWGTKYNDGYVNKLARGLERHVKQKYTFTVIEPDPFDPLLAEPGCLVRLKIFDPAFQAGSGLSGRIVQIDLDVVITGELDPLFNRPESFVILQGANSSNPCPYNGSLMMLRAGEHPEVWREFSWEAVSRLQHYAFPDDQDWLAVKLPGAAGWQAGHASGVWSFRKRGWPGGDALPPGARMVCFPGQADPSQVARLPWVQTHWQ